MNEQVAIVVGGTKKLGLAIASRLVDGGYQTLVVSRSAEAVDAAVESLGDKAAGFVGDVLEPGTRSAALDKARSMGVPSVLVNAAGHFVWKPFDKLEESDWDQTLDVQLKAPFLMSQAFAAQAKAGASIVNIGSIHGPVGDKNVVAQCAAKAGVLGLTRGLAEALRDEGIRVNAVLPGGIASDTAVARSEGLGAMITQGDVAETVFFLASDASRGVTGASLEAYGVTRPMIATPG